MSWTTPKAWAYKELPLSNNFNTYIRDNNNYLKNFLDALIPIGTRWIWTTDSAPTGWLLCQGQAISRSTYSALFAVIGTTYGVGDNSTTFNLPNAKGRVAVGKDATAEFDTLGEIEGASVAKTQTLATTQLPAHTHYQGSVGGISANHTHQSANTEGVLGGDTHTHTFGNISLWTNHSPYTNELTGLADDSKLGGTSSGESADHVHDFTTGWVNYDHGHTFTTDNGTGGAGSHNNLMPYQVINFIIKY
jgi:microcystin-dependent protein